MPVQASPEVTPERIFQLAFGYAPPLILEAAIRHGVFDVLDEGPKSLARVTSETGASERGLKAVMNALVGLEFLRKDEAGLYCLTPESATFLVTTKPSFQGGILRHTSERLLPKWLTLTEIVRTGKPSYPVNQETVGGEFFHELVQDIFPMSYLPAQNLAEALGLAKADAPISVLDIATGSGVWGIALAQKSRYVRVTGVDWPEVVPVARQYAERFGLSDRFSFVEGDILAVDFGTGHQIATLGHILHSEGLDRSKALLSKVFGALEPGGLIAIAEMVPDEGRASPPFPLIFAVNMLVNTDTGDTFTFNEMKSWLEEAGFRDIRSLDAHGPSPLILATKPH
ncbi:MAG: methyltransferase [Capsulimonadaceae bacterium]